LSQHAIKGDSMTAMTRPEPAECSIVTVERRLTAVAKVTVPLAEIPQGERSARGKLEAALPSLDVGPIGAAFTLWRPPVNGIMEMEPGVLVSRPFEPRGEVVASAVPAGRAAHLLHVGSYEGIPGAWQTLFDWCNTQKRERAGINWQIYGDWNDDPAKLTTALYALLA
jgi:effector-binding domain-containing protein